MAYDILYNLVDNTSGQHPNVQITLKIYKLTDTYANLVADNIPQTAPLLPDSVTFEPLPSNSDQHKVVHYNNAAALPFDGAKFEYVQDGDVTDCTVVKNGDKFQISGGGSLPSKTLLPDKSHFVIHIVDADNNTHPCSVLLYRHSTTIIYAWRNSNNESAGSTLGVGKQNNEAGNASFLLDALAGTGGGGAGSVGDPYVQPMFGPTIKLPNIETKYCLYHDQELTITGSTKNINKEHQQKIVEYSEQFPTSFHNVLGKKLITEGILYDKFYIATNNEYVLIDVEKRTITTSKDCAKTFTMKMEEDRCNMDIFEEMACKSLNIRFKTPNHGNVRVAIQFFENPQIDNGIYLHMDRNVAQGTGLLVRNYKPKLLQINNLTTVPAKMEKRLKKTKNPFTQRGILSKGEMWNTVNNKQTKITLH